MRSKDRILAELTLTIARNEFENYEALLKYCLKNNEQDWYYYAKENKESMVNMIEHEKKENMSWMTIEELTHKLKKVDDRFKVIPINDAQISLSKKSDKWINSNLPPLRKGDVTIVFDGKPAFIIMRKKQVSLVKGGPFEKKKLKITGKKVNEVIDILFSYAWNNLSEEI